MAAIHAQVDSVPIEILKMDEDLLLQEGPEMLRLTPHSTSFWEHRLLVFKMVHDGTEATLLSEARGMPYRPPKWKAASGLCWLAGDDVSRMADPPFVPE